MTKVNKSLSLILALALCACSQIQGQDKGAKAGAVIIVDIEGEVKVQNLKSKQYLKANEVTVGKSIFEGHAIETTGQGKTMLLFSNGSMTTLTGKSKLAIQEFKQTPFKGGAETIGALKKEPSASQTRLKLDYGDLIFSVKQLNDDSNYVLESPVGSAAIRGTAGQLAVSINEAGVASGGVNMVEGQVSFTDPSGNTADVPAGQGTVVQVDPAGEQIGATQSVQVPAQVAQSVTQTATETSNAAQNITVENLSNAAQEASTQAEAANQDTPSEGEDAGEDAGEDGEPEGESQNSQQEVLETISAQAAGAAGGIIFIAAGAGKDVDFVADLAGQLTNVLATEMALQAEVLDIPRELIIAATIQGAVEGAVAAATIAGMDADAIAQIKAAAGNVSEPVAAMLGGISLEDILGNVDPTQLIAEVTETGITDADIDALGEGMEEVSLDIFISDRDGDGLADATEDKIGSDPDNPDSDGDLLMDGVEYHIFACDPQSPDSDGDGVSDSVEVGLGTEPLIPDVFGIDSDRDAIPDDYEVRLGTNPNQADSDGDGWHDGFELGVGSNPLVKDVLIAKTGFTVSPLSPGDPHAWLFLGNPPE